PKQDALAPPEQAAPPPPAATFTREVTLADPNGLHLRPAARCVEIAARFDATLHLRYNGRVAPLDSPTALMALGAKGDAAVTIEASGPEAEPAAAALAAILAERPADSHTEPGAIAAPGGVVPMSPGRVAGPVVAVSRALPAVPETTVTDRAAARARLDEALAAARAALAGNPILAAQAALLADPALIGPARAAIEADGRNEAAAWRDAIAAVAASHDALDDPYLRARARDLREAGDAVLRELLGGFGLDLPAAPAIIAVDDLTAAEAASLPPTTLGVLDRRGGPTSHAAILLRAAGIPALGGVVLDKLPTRVAFDGATGELITEPDAATEARFRAADRLAPGPASVILPCGEALEFWANVAGPADAAAAARAGAFGIGLARTEMLFLGRADMPGEDEQEARIAAMIAPFRGRPVVVRLLDAGADKPVPFLALAAEENPALGVRGVRALLRRPEFCAAHLRA
ncbi:MAG: dihydroxyacetone kinase, partial [Acidiphilium sp. 37-67-22]